MWMLHHWIQVSHDIWPNCVPQLKNSVASAILWPLHRVQYQSWVILCSLHPNVGKLGCLGSRTEGEAPNACSILFYHTFAIHSMATLLEHCMEAIQNVLWWLCTHSKVCTHLQLVDSGSLHLYLYCLLTFGKACISYDRMASAGALPCGGLGWEECRPMQEPQLLLPHPWSASGQQVGTAPSQFQ